MISIKSQREIDLMVIAGNIVYQTHKHIKPMIKPGISLLELDAEAEKFIISKGAKPSFKGYDGFPNATCISVNEEVVHGIPSNRKLKKGDIVSIDIGAEYIGKSEYDWDYIFTDLKPEAELPKAPMLCYYPAENIKLTNGEALANMLLPYFNRTKLHYCGHQNTPHNKDGEVRPAIVKKGSVIYMAHSMSGMYEKYGSLYYKRYVMAALNLLYTLDELKELL